MGVSCPNETKCLSKVLSNGSTIRKNFYAEFNTSYFAKGGFRYCYIGTIKNLSGDEITTNDFPTGKMCCKSLYKSKFYSRLSIRFSWFWICIWNGNIIQSNNKNP